MLQVENQSTFLRVCTSGVRIENASSVSNPTSCESSSTATFPNDPNADEAAPDCVSGTPPPSNEPKFAGAPPAASALDGLRGGNVLRGVSCPNSKVCSDGARCECCPKNFAALWRNASSSIFLAPFFARATITLMFRVEKIPQMFDPKQLRMAWHGMLRLRGAWICSLRP